MIKVQLLTSTAKPPIKVDPAAVGWDVFADSVECKDGMLIYKCGIAVEPPEGWWFAFCPRSSQSSKECVYGNSLGIIEPEFRGNLQVRLRPVGYYYGHIHDNKMVNIEARFGSENEYGNWDKVDLPFQIGDRIGQIVLLPFKTDDVEIVDKLNETARGSSGFGEFTGK